MINTIAQNTENVNAKQVNNVMGALRGIGGTFADPNLGLKNMNSINTALTNPSNDYQKARSFGVLASMNPGGSYFQTLEAQEQGISKKGYLSGVLKQLKSETGGGENFALSAMQNFGLGAGTSRKLTEAYSKNPSMFSNFTGQMDDASINKFLGGGRSESLVTDREKDKTKAEEADRLGIAAGLIEKAGQSFTAATKDFLKGTANIGEVLGMGSSKDLEIQANTNLDMYKIMLSIVTGNGNKKK
jgi:hypothetical protein